MAAPKKLTPAVPKPDLRVLVIEDSPSLSAIYEEYLIQAGICADVVETGVAALGALQSRDYSVVLLDLQLPDMDGMDILRQVGAGLSPASVVVITADGSVDTAVRAMRLGAYDYLVKPFNAERLATTVRNVAERHQLAQMVETICSERVGFEGFIGASLPMQAVYRMIESAAASKATVFITGESGTGKEVCAEAIHRQSPRRDGPFVPLNCGAIPKDLIESEVFGHLKGAFTGAIANREGAAAKAHGGTLFLDEICEMGVDLQTKLLRFTQTGKFQRVGSDRLEDADIRIICATNREPQEEVASGRFREDLFYRLHVIPIHLPPLRERGNDVVEIARHFLRDYCREEDRGFVDFSEAAQRALRNHLWPGNVRELQNVVRNIVVLNEGEAVSASMLEQSLGSCPPTRVEAQRPRRDETVAGTTVPSMFLPAGETPSVGVAEPLQPEEIKPLWRYEREIIEAAIEACAGNLTRAATLLQVNPSTIYRKRKGWEATDGAARAGLLADA